ncbi:cryptochrome/photolyase family protein [Thermoleptolyngbya sichuanensis XZ-Cy5]|uniref:cryptochrome/photolyase family protein n=1 Tax=Thermoleptolyngbya sichuanensis TaxID=2885951 RepID=UPI00240E3A35|nr:cryptochrome/photolyase family protein [Thermoleptolyngbya sichuanensis]MDG2617400.1 cryptochrome/photolyase family protein [Thermoleptolyngbya sichuanensis XZ-Cy5]
MTIGIWVLGDQLWQGQAALQSRAEQAENTPVILIESLGWVRLRPYHKQKLVLVWSAMRHFAAELREAGWPVTYETAEDFESPLVGWIEANGITELRVMTPGDRPFLHLIQSLNLPCDLNLLPNNHFLWQDGDFAAWAKGRKNLLLEYFYREGRQRFGVLMEGKQPVGGAWNFDKDNRKPPKGKLNPPAPLEFEPDAMTREVMQQVRELDCPTYGELEPFRWGVGRSHALQVLDHFIATRLPTFGPYQDAMVTGEDTMWHALLSPYLNLGLLRPLEVIHAAERAYHEQALSLSSVEGFIRQVLGWREYMYGLYHHVEADYAQRNWFQHTQPLPAFFWDSTQTDMNCLRQTLRQVERTGYAHHIQRLMILANFSLIAGFSPQEVENWFHAAFIDAYDWVMQTNVIGMGLFADGGILASKPYAASANYVNKMSDYCKGCRYDPKQRTGKNACPFNFFYWDFLDRHRAQLKSQGRINLILANLDKMPPEELQAIRQHAKDWHEQHSYLV